MYPGDRRWGGQRFIFTSYTCPPYILTTRGGKKGQKILLKMRTALCRQYSNENKDISISLKSPKTKTDPLTGVNSRDTRAELKSGTKCSQHFPFVSFSPVIAPAGVVFIVCCVAFSLPLCRYCCVMKYPTTTIRKARVKKGDTGMKVVGSWLGVRLMLAMPSF